MKFLFALKDILLTVLCIITFCLFLSFTSKGKTSLIQQNNEVITLIPMEAYLRGSIKIDVDNSITNWRNEKNIVHWRFKCTQSGTYKATLIHNRSSKAFKVVFKCGKQELIQTLETGSKETRLGPLELGKGTQGVAFYAPVFPKKSKLPAIFSIILTKTN